MRAKYLADDSTQRSVGPCTQRKKPTKLLGKSGAVYANSLISFT